MIDPLKRHEIQTLLASGLTVRDVAVRTGVARQTVWRIGSEDPVVDVDDMKFKLLRRVGRPSDVAKHRVDVAAMLTTQPEIPTHEVLRLLRVQGYEGGKSAVYELVRLMRPVSPRPMVRFEGLAGEFSQHDFGEVVVTYVNGTKDRIHFFASRLKYSRYAHVTMVANQRVESLVRALVVALARFGGIPLLGVFDNPKTIVKKRRGDVIEWNATFAQAILDLRLGVELCWPHSGNQKGAVERVVGWVKNSFFKVRRFRDRQDVLEQLTQWLREGNEERPSRATGVIPAVRLVEERQRMRPLPITPAEFSLRFPVLVGPTGFVEHEGIRYAMPPPAIGIPGTLHLFPDRVRIVAGRHDASHPRFPEGTNTSWGEGGRAAWLAAVSGERGRLRDTLEEYIAPDVLLIDEVGYLAHRADAANVLFHVVNERHIRRLPTLFTTNKPLAEWGKVLHDPDLADTIVDRVLERGRLFELRGKSYRTRHLRGELRVPRGGAADTSQAEPSPGPQRLDQGRPIISGKSVPELPEPASGSRGHGRTTTCRWTARV